MQSMQLAYPPFPAGEHPKATRRIGNKNANSIFSKRKRQLKSPGPKIGLRAAKSSLSRAEPGPCGRKLRENATERIPQQQAGGQLLQISERKQNDDPQTEEYSLVVKSRCLFATWDCGALIVSRNNSGPELILRLAEGDLKKIIIHKMIMGKGSNLSCYQRV